jgi:hypothetical protein
MNPLTHLRRNIVAYIALFLALTAGAYAAGLKKNSVGSKQIKTAAVKSDEIADGAVTGAKIAKGTLGQVPNAEQADTATTATTATNAVNAQNAQNAVNSQNAVNAQNATNAQNAGHAETAGDSDTVGGQTVKTFSVSQEPGGGAKDVAAIGGLRLSLDCNGGGDNEIRATTAVNDANIKSVSTYANGGTTHIVRNDDDFDIGETALIVPHAEDASTLVGQIIYRTVDAKVVTVDFAVDSPAGQCSLWGSAIGS